MANAPKGAGCCAHCGTGILHHVIVQDENKQTAFIGTTCAEKVGLDRECLKMRMSSDEMERLREARKSKVAERERMDLEFSSLVQAYRNERRLNIGHLLQILNSADTNFHRSLASSLEVGPLSERQAHYVAKLTSMTGRRNKMNADAWDEVIELATSEFSDPVMNFYEWRKEYLANQDAAAPAPETAAGGDATPLQKQSKSPAEQPFTLSMG